MVTRAQGKAMGRGMVAALDRNKNRVKTIIEIDHAPHVPRQSLLKGVTRWLDASGAVNMQHTTVSLGDADLLSALEQSERMRDHFRKQFEDLKQQVEDLLNLSRQPREHGLQGWMTLTRASETLGVDYSTLWRAARDGRLKTTRIGGRKKNQLMCDPTTYRPKRPAKSK